MDIFEFLNAESNDILSKMNEKDKNQLLNLLKSYKISLRDRLNLDDRTSFGLELEFGKDDPKNIECGLKTLNYRWLLEKRLQGKYWVFKKELSSTDGYEINTPIFFDEEESWKQLTEVCDLIRDNNGKIDGKDAGHIHFGSQILGNHLEDWLKFFMVYCLYENIIYRFSYGEFECERQYLSRYAYPLAREYSIKLAELMDGYKISLRQLFTTLQTAHKTRAIQFYKMSNGGTSFEENRTFEFRMPNATIEPAIWQNNVNFFAHLIYSGRKDLDLDLLKAKIDDKFETFDNLHYYNRINIDEALELADLLFDNNLDKINFLRQYMKEFESHSEFRHTDSFVKSK